MKIFFICLLLLILSDYALCQDSNSKKTIRLESNDAYILKFKLVEEISSFMYVNCYTQKRIKTSLFKIQIDQIILASDTSVYNNSELSMIKYALFNIIPTEHQLIGTFYNSESKQYLIFNRTLEFDPMKESGYYQHAVIVGLSSCRNDKKIINAMAKYELEKE
ncbi:MAG: hypothetical protein HXX13_17710 [Bacteroidetes bacterium]|nr:hypothetical protein [Bacteroidota bacterium]